MRVLAFTVLVLLITATAYGQSWEDIANESMASFGIGPSGTTQGTVNGSGVPQFNMQPQGYNQDRGWDYEGMEQQQHRAAEQSYWRLQGSYGVPHNEKPIAPCGPYYAPRAAKNCY